MPEQSVDQRAVGVTRRRVDNETAGLVDHDDIRILKNNVERELLRHERHVGGRREQQLEFIPGAAAVVLPYRQAVERDTPVLEQMLGGAAGQFLHRARKESVDPLAALPGSDDP